MNAQELLTAPASTLTRKQRRDRAALKRQMAAMMQLPAGYALGRVRTPIEDWGAEVTINDEPVGRSGHVIIRMPDQA